MAIAEAAIKKTQTTPPAADKASQVVFRIEGLYGLASESLTMPLNRHESFETGNAVITLDPHADPSTNLGIIDYDGGTLRVRYGVQLVFPGLHDLVVEGGHDPSLLRPARAIATDECTLTEDFGGWQAYGCLELLPGSIWAGTKGT